ncbi:MAG: ankyrin repeat domain-containing protein, partial [Candidatus Eremiobacterota bacterium]
MSLIKILPLIFFLILMPAMAETSEDLIKKGEELVNQNEVTKTEEGQKYFQKATELDPHSLKAWVSLVICLNNLDTYDQMKDTLNKAIKNDLDINKENVNARLVQDWTPLTVAVYCQNIKACKLLIDKGADVNLAQDGGMTPLDLAACYGLKDIAELLIEHGADINMKDNKIGWSSLMGAVFYRQYDMVEYLISKGAYTGDYPLFYAVCTNNIKEIKSLVNKRTVNS